MEMESLVLTTSSANFSLSSASSGMGVAGVRACRLRPPPPPSATQYVISGGSSGPDRQPPHQPRRLLLILPSTTFPPFSWVCRLLSWSEILLRSGLGSFGPWTSARPSPPNTEVRLVRENLSLRPSNFTLGRESSTCNVIRVEISA